MSTIKEPQLGMRFTMFGAKFEVSFVADGIVRYSSTAGGQVHRVPFAKFLDLQLQGSLTISSTTDVVVTAHNCDASIRKYRYLEAAIRMLPHPRKISS